MSYERMWDPEPPTADELFVGRIRAGGGLIARHPTDVPKTDHWAIIRHDLFHGIPLTYIVYQDRDQWLSEVKELAKHAANFTPIVAKVASTKVEVNVSVDVKT